MVLRALIEVVGAHSKGERDSINVWTEELNKLIGSPVNVPFCDEATLRECSEWCSENELPQLTMMLSADKQGMYLDQLSCRLAFGNRTVPSGAEMKKAWVKERAIITALTEDDVSKARNALIETVNTLNISMPNSRRTIANARNQEIEAQSLEQWLDLYQTSVLNVMAPGQPIIHNDFVDAQEGYKERFWDHWNEILRFDKWAEGQIGSGEIVEKLRPSFKDDNANWITKRFGGFDLRSKLEEKEGGIERFEKVAYGFYLDNIVAKEFFDEAVSLLGCQYPVISHLMFLKNKDAYVPVKPDALELGLRKLGVEFYLSGCCSWDNYTRFLGYLERIRQMLLEIDPATTLLDAHSVLWIIGSGYWFDGDGAKEIERKKAGAAESC